MNKMCNIIIVINIDGYNKYGTKISLVGYE